LPPGIENFLIVDCTVYVGDPFESDESILAGEVSGETREAVQPLIFFLPRYLCSSPRFQPVIASEILSGNIFSGSLPRPISETLVRGLCRYYQTDALVAIEQMR
jgi:hypothetical protein